jgi:ribonucleoside-triphosphate reductase
VTDEINFGPTGRLVFERTYSRTKPDGSKETWPETVNRVVDGNLALVDERYQIPGEREDLVSLMTDFKILPAGRHLWASGVKNAQHLFNPVVGSSEVTTRDGVRKIEELVGQTIDVLSMSDNCDMATRRWESVGKWRPATFIYSGEQDTYRVTFESGREVVSTAEHNWFSVRSRKKLTTLDLVGESIPVMAVERPEENLDYMQGLLRGVIFGDGTVDTTGSKIQIYADENEEVIDLFRRAGHKHSYSESRGFWYVGRLPMEWKLELPSVSESPSFWRGFFAGWLAADGHVNQKGSVMIHNRDREVFDRCHDGFEKAGIHMINEPVLCRTKNPFTGEASTLYRQSFKRYSLSARDFVQQKKRDRFLGTAIQLRTTTDKVVSVEKTGLTEPVYCCLESATHSWTVNGVLTGNCWVSGWTEKPSEHFDFTFMRLMEGGGVGANYSNRYLADYPPVQQELFVHIVCDEDHADYAAMRDAGVLSTEYDSEWSGAFIVEDSREGWAAALVDLIDTHYRDDVSHYQRVYDVSRVRPAGAKLKTFGGRASGPQPLAKMLIDVCEILSESHSCSDRLSGIEAMEIDHAIAQCVVAGGVRRSARMAMMHWNDPQIEEFMSIKQDSGSHWTTNISVEVDTEFWRLVQHKSNAGDWARGALESISFGMVRNGEPGFWDSSLSNVGEPNGVVCTNPCGEITLEPWEPCNLGHINLAAFVREDTNKVDYLGLEKAHRLMTRFLIRATFSEVGDPKSREVLDRNRRIGVGHFGVASFLALTGKRYSKAPQDRGFKDQLRGLAEVVDTEAVRFSHQLRIPVPVKKRTVAPTGTIAKMPGVSEGIHPIFSKYFIRRVRFSKNDPDQMAQVDLLDLQGYHVEDDLFAADTVVVSMPTKDTLVQDVVDRYGRDGEDIVEAASDLTLNEMLAFQALYQQAWADNAVSFTANVDPDQYTAADVAEQLTKFGGLLKGATVFPEASFEQAPYERISKAEYEAAEAKQIADGVDEACMNGGACPVR